MNRHTHTRTHVLEDRRAHHGPKANRPEGKVKCSPESPPHTTLATIEKTSWTTAADQKLMGTAMARKRLGGSLEHAPVAEDPGESACSSPHQSGLSVAHSDVYGVLRHLPRDSVQVLGP